MKKIFYSIIAFALVALIGCKKEEVVSDFENLGVGSYVTLVRTISNTMNFATISNASVGVTVKQNGSPIDKIKVFVSRGGKSVDKSTWRTIKEVPYAGDSVNITVSSQELATALGIPVTSLEPGSTYTFYNQVITKDGRTFDIANTPQHGISNYNMVLNWSASVVCPFTGNMAGNYRVITDDWQDWSPGDIVQVTDGPGANQVNLSKVWPNIAFGTPVQPFVVSVNPSTGAATVASGVTIGDYSRFGFTMVTGTGSTGFVFSCTGRISLRVRISAPPFGDQGFLNLVLQKI
ncbi:MAG TPA: hypothetical protein VM368_07125 [Flavisolibacter sp.]|nr:hypothetical protein [Flavisolibacter sp.]